MTTRTQPEDYYKIRDRVLELMADQAGKPFDMSNFRKQFCRAADEHGYHPGQEGYLPRFIVVRRWVKDRLPRMMLGPAVLVAKPPVLAPAPRAWRDPGAFDAHLAQLPPSDRD